MQRSDAASRILRVVWVIEVFVERGDAIAIAGGEMVLI
jgi:hypothetical protein